MGNVSITCKIKREELDAIFDNNPSLKEAFDHLWEGQKMDDWISKEVMPFLKSVRPFNSPDSENTVFEMMRSTLQMGTKKLLLDCGMEKFLEGCFTVSAEACILKVAEEQGTAIFEHNKELFHITMEETYFEMLKPRKQGFSALMRRLFN